MADLRQSGSTVIYIDDNGNTLYTLPTETGTENQVIVIDENGNLRFGDGVVGSTLGALSNVSDSVDSAGVGMFLKYNGNEWIADSIVQEATVAFSVQLETNMSSADYTNAVIIPFDNVIFDVGQGWDSAGFSYVIPVSGYYQLNSMVTSDNIEGAAWSEIRLKVNQQLIGGNANFSYRTLEDGQGGGFTTHTIAGVEYFEANDSIQIEYDVSGDTSTFIRSGARFSGFYIGSPSTAPNFSWNSISGKPYLLDSNDVQSIIGADYVTSLGVVGTDSNAVIDLISAVVNNTYVRARETPQDFAYSSLTGAPTIPSTTSDITEGSRLYYTNDRADARVNLQTGANLDLSQKSTTDLSEGNNLYYTPARAGALIDSAFGDATSLTIGDWKISVVSNKLTFSYNDIAKVSIDSIGEIVAVNDVTAFGSP